MKIRSIYCKEFKRFSELSVKGLTQEAKLICLVGPNGAGKSSLFDIFNYCIRSTKSGYGNYEGEPDYIIKVSNQVEQKTWRHFENIEIEFHDGETINSTPRNLRKETFYIRSGYRHEADVDVRSFQRQDDIIADSSRPKSMISADKRVAENYMRIVADSVESIFSDRLMDTSTKAEIRERLIGKVAISLSRLLPHLKFEGVGNPMEKGTFYFTKGAAKNWKYKNLSAGEKAAFDLLLDLAIKAEVFTDTVFCIDEPELHLHSELQARLLEEIFGMVPEKSQLWIATHSIGMMRKAKELAERSPGAVLFLDFDGRDFDQRVEMKPAIVSRLFWKKAFSVAIGDLADLIAPSHVVFCEGSQSTTTGSRSGEFDAKCYRGIFEEEFPDIEFISLGSASEVEKNALLLIPVFRQVIAKIAVSRVVDRDDRSESEIDELRSKGIRVLSKRHIESFLFDDEVLRRLCESVGKPEKADEVLAAKSAALAASVNRNNASDDYKSMSADLYVALKRILQLTGCGNTKEAFCIDTLAPLVVRGTAVYQQIRTDVIS